MIQVDTSAKLRIDMDRHQDGHNNDYFIGKIQFPGTLNFERGISFMLFTSEIGKEELQIAPIDETKRLQRKRIKGTRAKQGRVCIDLHSFEDGGGNTVYVGEAQCPTSIDCTEGIFLTAFTSRPGEEELQVSRLDHNRRKRDDRDDRELDETG